MKALKLTTFAITAALGTMLLTGPLAAQEASDNSNSAAKPGQVLEDPDSSTNNASAQPGSASQPEKSKKSEINRSAIVVFGHNAELKAGERAEAVVVIGGSAKIDGKVDEAAVAILGNLEVNGEVGDAAVSVLGDIKAGPNAKINGDAVAVGGKLDLAEGAQVSGGKQEIDWQVPGLPKLTWLRDWIVQCAFKLRPLAPQLAWLWLVVAVVFLFYLLIAAVFPRPVLACVEELNRRPATTFLIGLLTKLLTPLLLLVLAITGIGVFVIPFVLAALFLAAIVGKVALLEWIGLRIGGNFGSDSFRKPLVGFLVGSIVILVLYMIPILGFLTLLITSVWGLGCAVTAGFGGFRREQPPRAPAEPSPYVPQPAVASGFVPYSGPPYASAMVSPSAAAVAGTLPATGDPALGVGATGSAAAAAMVGEPPLVPEALSYPRATFWQRMGAGLLDMILVSIVASVVHSVTVGYLIALAYFAGMWVWKGTTVGGIVLGLKVVRVDGQPLSFPVALVRALGAAFSIVVLFLGFFWIAWDPDKQGWHDRIAGTFVIRLPKGTPLLCI